jgi:hypothetical protein
MTHLIAPMPGALELVRSFKDQQLKLGIATSSNSYSVNKKLQNHRELFECIDVTVCGDDSEV